jgi:myo-inositol-1(or 4)-monophosphatase
VDIRPPATRVTVEELRAVLADAVAAVRVALDAVEDPRRPGRRPGQYDLDLVADEAALGVLHGAGLVVVSEESGRTVPPRAAAGMSDLVVVVDPVDGSTNASLGIPWFATSLCVLDDDGPLVSLVVNQASGARYEAVRDGGALRDGHPIRPSGCTRIGTAVIGVSGLPAGQPGWAQFRALGAAALDMCAVAEGVLDGYRVAGGTALFGWDYLGAMLVCAEAGAVVGDVDGNELVVRDDDARRPVVASGAALYEQLLAAQI